MNFRSHTKIKMNRAIVCHKVRFCGDREDRTEEGFKDEVLTALKEMGAEVNGDLEAATAVTVGNTAVYEQEQLEMHLEVFAMLPMELAAEWCNVRRSVGLPHAQISFQFAVPETFGRDVFNTTQPVTLSAVGLGAMMNQGTLVEHATLCNESSPDKMWSEWQHDVQKGSAWEKYSLQVTIKFRRMNPQSALVEGYKMELEYKSLHSVTVDPLPTGEVDLIFVLRHAPKVFKAVPPEAISQNWKEEEGADSSSTTSEQRAAEEKAQLRREDNRRSRFESLEWKDWWREETVLDCPNEVIKWASGLRLRMRAQQDFHRYGNRGVIVRLSARCVAWEIMGRLKSRGKLKTISFCPVHIEFVIYRRGFPRLVDEFKQELSQNFHNLVLIKFTLEALLSRGYYVLNQLVDSEQQRKLFISVLQDLIQIDLDITENSLEQLVAAIDERKNLDLCQGLYKIFLTHLDFLDEEEERGEADGEGAEPLTLGAGDGMNRWRKKTSPSMELPKDCILIKKVVVTPTKVFPLCREVMAGNRVTRQFGDDGALRIAFKDEDGGKITFRGKGSGLGEEIQDQGKEPLLDRIVKSTMMNSLEMGGTNYSLLAWSNSQMREHSAYFFASGKSRIEEMRKSLGNFEKNKNVAKRVSRMGQCFTQAIVGMQLSPGDFCVEDDIESEDLDIENGEPFCFSDGCGCLSPDFAKRIAQKWRLPFVPSAFQIRFQGFKGMLSVNMAIQSKVIFRQSMKKFESDNCDDLEIVKHSSPCKVYLNRPLLTILDQQSAQNGERVHQRMTGRIKELLEKELFALGDMLLNERDCVYEVTDRLPIRLDFIKLKTSGFSLTSEPFFRRLLLAIHRYRIKQNLLKLKIEIPHYLGRTAFGVLDETKSLMYGQVFFQPTCNVRSQKANAKTFVCIGPIMLTKNPCIHAGDVQVLEAVDVPALRHLKDVLVFPQDIKNPKFPDAPRRPHPDQLAGSDLDGDEYAIFLDQEMMFEENAEPMSFPKFKQRDQKSPIKESDIVNHFLKFMKEDCVGHMSNAHLVAADRHGLHSEICESIAKKVAAAVDFAKSGAKVEQLDVDERSHKYPDFMQKDNKPAYRSRRLLGQLFRKVEQVDDILEQFQLVTEVKVDPDLLYPGWEEFEEEARRLRDSHNSQIQFLMDTYGIEDEASLVSGHITVLKNRISDKEKEDFSFFNTDKIIEDRYMNIFKNFREKFLKRMGVLEQMEQEEITEEQALETPDEQSLKFGSAWYAVTYQDAQSNPNAFLSFPWIVWDVLKALKLKKKYGPSIESASLEVDPVYGKLNQELDIQTKRIKEHPLPSADRYSQLVRSCCARYSDLLDLIHIFFQWAKHHVCYPDGSKISDLELAHLFVQYGRGKLEAGKEDKDRIRIEHDMETDEEGREKYEKLFQVPPLAEFKDAALSIEEVEAMNEEDHDMGVDIPKIGTKRAYYILGFMRLLSTEAFRRGTFDFTALGLERHLPELGLQVLNRAATTTFHTSAVSGDFSYSLFGHELAPRDSNRASDQGEMEPVMVEFSESFYLKGGHKKVLKTWSGVDEIAYRHDKTVGRPRKKQFIFLASGKARARQKLRELLIHDDLEESLANNREPMPFHE